LLSLDVATEEQLPLIRQMFRDYERELDIDLCFQGFEEELASLPGKYGPPRGVLLVASVGEEVAGCGAIRDLGDGICELKRIYVRPEYRGRNIGKSISSALLDRAAALGYHTAKLDTLSKLKPAIKLYQDLGFQVTEPYNFNAGHDIVYMELRLSKAKTLNRSAELS
jgi:GNAT superfamily N-acetyltransferase